MSAVCQRTEQRADRRSSAVIDLELVRVARMAKELVPDLEVGGIVRAAVEELDDVERWRRAARRAGRSLGWRIRTGVSAGWVWAVSEDWEPPPGADREAARLFSALIAPGPFDRGWG